MNPIQSRSLRSFKWGAAVGVCRGGFFGNSQLPVPMSPLVTAKTGTVSVSPERCSGTTEPSDWAMGLW